MDFGYGPFLGIQEELYSSSNPLEEKTGGL
jgi:hypothetical protein